MNNNYKTLAVLFAVALVLAVCLITGPAIAYQEMSVSEGGSISGKVVFKGTAPMRTVVPTKDKEVCGGVRKEPLIEIGKDDGVVNAVAYLKGVQKGKAWQKKDKYMIDNKDCRFHPHVQVVPVGSDFSIHNSDPMLHNTHSFAGMVDGKTVFNVALPFPGASVTRKLNSPGVMRVECDVHGWMRGWVYVADNPYYSATAEDGSFAISDVPPGDYTLVIWQEHAGSLEKQVSVKAGQKVDVGVIELPK
jgi:plastocyanin